MRKRKPAAKSGPSCQRCTAVLFAGLDRCGMCGWPSGVGYPAADGELERAAAAPEADESASTEDDDHVGVQLDALAGMVARQGQPMVQQEPDEPSEPPPDAGAPAAPEAEAADDAPLEDASDESLEPAAEQQPEAPSVTASPETEDVDPLTAPLTALTASPAPASDSEQSGDKHVAPEASSDSDHREETDETPVLLTKTVEPVESADDRDDTSEVPSTKTPGRAAAILRPAQFLLIGTAVVNLVFVALRAMLGTTSGSTTGVVLGLALIMLALWAGAAVTFLHWISRAHTHVAANAASRQRHGASMSLLGWFIPIAGIIIGYRVLQDLWTGSDPATRNDAEAAPAKVRMIDVWVLGIVTAALFGFAMPMALGGSALWAGISGVGLLVAALGLVSTMGTISDWQHQVAKAETPDAASSTAEEATAEDEVSSTAATTDRPSAPQPVSAAAE